MSLPRPIEALLYVGPIALLAIATVFGVTEVHSSTDTYIGLAGGRSILEATDGFPIRDTFSYTVPEDRWWFNQNWLTHVWQYWLYDRLGPDAVVWGTWAMSASIFVLSLFAVWFRTGNLLAAILAASVVGFGCRDFISPRPATTGYFLVSAFWMLLCALEGQAARPRWWPIVLMLPLLVLWGCAHGSFVFGYVLLVIYVAYWILRWAWRDWLFPTRRPNVWIDVVLFLITAVVCWFVCYGVVPKRLLAQSAEVKVRFYTFITLGAIALAGLLYAAFVRDRRRAPAISAAQMNSLAVVVVLGFFLTVLLSPFGFANFFHVRDVAESDVWRRVSEWHPPYIRGNFFPPVGRFWTILGSCAGAVLIAAVATVASRGARQREVRSISPLTAFDVLTVMIGLMMALFARRFAPMFYILGAPVITAWLVNSVQALPAMFRGAARYAWIGLAWVGTLGFGIHTWKVVQWELSGRFEGMESKVKGPDEDDSHMNLLERVSRYDATPHDALVYLHENDLRANVLTEWTQAGPLMFYAPSCRVYMDGRAQQVYDEQHYLNYQELVSGRRTSKERIRELLNESNTQIVLLRRVRSQATRNLWRTLERGLPEWTIVMVGDGWAIFARVGSPPFRKICRRIRAGTEWRPDTAPAIYQRGVMQRLCRPPNYEGLIADMQEAVRRDVRLAQVAWPQITQAYLLLNQPDEAMRYIQTQAVRMQSLAGSLNDKQRADLSGALNRCAQMIREARGGSRPAEEND